MKLNEQQISAVNHINGPLLILAGAGSGKTRVLTERTANLITNFGIHPYNILAVTFTNKAAKEMKERIANRIGDEKAKSLWIGTFHSICSRILRAEIHLLNRNSNFVIYDSTDQNKLVNECLKKLNIDEKNYPPAKVLKEISKAKSSGFSAENYIHNNLDYKSQKTGEIYMMYESELKKNNALDFDDMLFYVVKIFNEHEDRLQHYQKKFKYIMVDEYQDTNQIQYMLITMLAGMYQNICVVGDVDQSIYSFRNADFRIILNFQKDYQNAEIIKLETNYRSTKNIVALSNEIIKENKERFPKNLNTDNSSGEKIRIYEAVDDEEEVRFIIREMYRLIEKGYDYNDFTVLYRTNAQSRVFEEYFVRNNIPHQIIGGFRFFERKEIKDLLSYLKFIFNPYDTLSLQRIINTPKRGIGNTTIEKLMELSNHFNLPLWDILNFQNFDNINAGTQRTIREFVNLMNTLMELSSVVSVSKLIKEILEKTNYIVELQKEDEKESKDKNRIENVYQLINSANDFEMNSDDVSLEAYLNYISLLSDTDSIDGESNHVKLMTIHTSKGLEFPVVFVAGVAEGLFPHANSASTYEIEEERRLMYVAVTRAKKILYLTFPRKRNMFGSTQHHVASRFISECPPDLVYGYNTDKAYNDKIYSSSPYSNQNRGYQERSYYQKNYDDTYTESSFKKKSSSYDEFLDEDFSGRSSFAKREKTSKKLDTTAIQKELEKRYSTPSNNSSEKSFQEGQRVKNDKWGLGTITKVMKNKDKTILIINFDDVGGSKILDPSLSKINVV